MNVQFLEETPAVRSLGKLWEEHGYSYEWASSHKPRLTTQGKKTICRTDNFVPFVVPGLSASSGTSPSSTSPVQDLPSPSSITERRDEPAPGNWRKTDPITENQNKKKMAIEIRTSVCKTFLNGWRSSQTIKRTKRCLCPRTFLGTQIRNVLRK